MATNLMTIGNDIASLWGASCLEAQIDADAKRVVFVCMEHGELFAAPMSFDDIKSEYGYDVM